MAFLRIGACHAVNERDIQARWKTARLSLSAGIQHAERERQMERARVTTPMTRLMTTTRPTRGQQRLLDLANRAVRRLRGERRADGAAVYHILELSETQPPRVIMEVHPRMVAQLLAAGWIEWARGTATAWDYRVTPEGTAAEHGPTREG